jgi:hypothetical protein
MPLCLVRTYQSIYKVYGRVGVVLWMKLETIVFVDKPAYLAVRVINVSEGEGAGRAGINAGRRGVTISTGYQSFLHPIVNTFHTKITFLGGSHLVRVLLFTGFLEVGMNPAGEKPAVFVSGDESAVLVGAGDDAVTAADALILIDHNDAIIPAVGRPGRANVNTRCVPAVVAANGVG